MNLKCSKCDHRFDGHWIIKNCPSCQAKGSVTPVTRQLRLGSVTIPYDMGASDRAELVELIAEEAKDIVDRFVKGTGKPTPVTEETNAKE